jgi:hypothetical protein
VPYECACIKVSLSMPDDLLRTVTDYAGSAMFDKYVAAAVEQRLRMDLLGDLSKELDADFGPIPPEIPSPPRHSPEEGTRGR